MDWSALDIKKELALGEDSTRQFKRQIDSAARLAEEFCAFSNSRGGILYIGVEDNGTIAGISAIQQGQYNQFISNAASDILKPAIYPITKVVEIDDKKIMLIYVPEGTAKPYCTSAGIYYVKSGSDKRKASPNELLRLYQQNSMIFLDETTTAAGVVTEGAERTIDLAKFYVFYEKDRGRVFSQEGVTVGQAFESMNLAKEGKLTLGGLLLFGDNPQLYKPYCLIRAVSYYGTAISGDKYRDKNDCTGTLEEQYRGAMNFLKNNLAHIQPEGSFNQQGVLEIHEKALEEAVVNALLHRDYSKNAVIRLLIYDDRVEIISPGSLPNHLTVENIIQGNSVIRNPTIVSFATKILPYTGIGSGIARILKYHPDTSFSDDKDGEQFTITMKRPPR